MKQAIRATRPNFSPRISPTSRHGRHAGTRDGLRTLKPWPRDGRKIYAAVMEAMETRQLLAATLDLEFNGGSALADFSSAEDFGYSTHVMDDGRILVAGFASGGTTGRDMAVVRFSKNGQLDTSFGSGGMVRVDLGSGQDQAYSVAVDGGGRVVLAGATRTLNGGFDFAVARLNADGSLDGNFGSGGKVVVDFSRGFDQAYSVAVHGTGLVVAGSANFQFGLLRLNGDGSLDTTFGVNGRRQTYLAGYGSEAYALDVQGDGRILAAGYAYFDDTSESNVALVRYNPDGSLDTTFGVNGVTTQDFGGYDDAARSVKVVDGAVYVAGQSNDDVLVAKFSAQGELDLDFAGGAGKFTFDVNGESDAAYGLTVDSDGGLLVSGHVRENNDRDFAVLKLRGDGSCDENFARGGLFRHDLGSNDESAQSVAVDADGNVVLAGFAATSRGHDFAVVRLRTTPPNEAPVADAGAGYTVVEGTGVQLTGASSFDPDGTVVSYEWDLDYDGTFAADATGMLATFSAADRDDGPVVVALRVTDDKGAVHVVTTTVAVTNAAPKATFATTFGGVVGQSITFNGGFVDPGALDTHQVRWSFGDGTVIEYRPTTDDGALTPQHAYADAGTYTITMTVTDDDGASVSFSRTMTIGTVGLQADPADPSKTVLVVGGTAGDDKIQIIGLGRLGYMVFVNNKLQGTYQPTGSLAVYGNGGTDKVQIVGQGGAPVKVYGAPTKKTSPAEAARDTLKDLLQGSPKKAA